MYPSLKKNIANELSSLKVSKVLFFDEARFGTHSKRGYGWFARGTRPTVNVKVGYQNFYLYGSVDVSDGSNFSLILPWVNTECLNLYLLKLSEEYSNERVALIMDGAGWHKSKDLAVPENIKIVYLPPYSPELNPVERLWLHIKSNVLTNKLYEKISDLEGALCKFIQTIKDDEVKRLCTAHYLSS